MKKRLLLNIVVVFGGLLSSLCTLCYGDLDKTSEDVLSALLDRAKCFQGIIYDTDIERYGLLLPAGIGRDCTFCIYIQPRDDGGRKYHGLKCFEYDVQIMSLAGCPAISYYDNKEKTPAFYYESGSLANEEYQIAFFPTGQIASFQKDTDRRNRKKQPHEAEIKWTESGAILSSKNLDILSADNYLVKEPKMRSLPPSKKRPQPPLKLPETEHKDVREVLERLHKIYSARTLEQLFPCLTYPIAKKMNARIAVNISAGKQREIVIAEEFSSNRVRVTDPLERKKLEQGLSGYFLELGDGGQPQFYKEGTVDSNVGDQLMKLLNLSEKKQPDPDTADDEVLFFYRSGRLLDGIEIGFHLNGCPSYYRSLVRGRLYGRQIEWNDRGRVISDVDIDIPKEIEKK